MNEEDNEKEEEKGDDEKGEKQEEKITKKTGKCSSLRSKDYCSAVTITDEHQRCNSSRWKFLEPN